MNLLCHSPRHFARAIIAAAFFAAAVALPALRSESHGATLQVIDDFSSGGWKSVVSGFDPNYPAVDSDIESPLPVFGGQRRYELTWTSGITLEGWLNFADSNDSHLNRLHVKSASAEGTLQIDYGVGSFAPGARFIDLEFQSFSLGDGALSIALLIDDGSNSQPVTVPSAFDESFFNSPRTVSFDLADFGLVDLTGDVSLSLLFTVGSNVDFLLNQISVSGELSAVPEVSSLSLSIMAGLALGACLAYRRRRQRLV